jgi:hypothetical protein
MDVVHSRRHADDLGAVDRDREVVPRIGKELGRRAGIDRVVEDASRHAVENRGVTGPKQSDHRVHRACLLRDVISTAADRRV